MKSTKNHPGNRFLKGVLGTAALAASRSKGTYFSAKYHRIASRRGPMKALVAMEHSMLIAAFNMLTNGEFYRDPGADYFTQRTPAKTKARAISQLEALGHHSPCNHSQPPHNHPSNPIAHRRNGGHVHLSSPSCGHLHYRGRTPGNDSATSPALDRSRLP